MSVEISDPPISTNTEPVEPAEESPKTATGESAPPADPPSSEPKEGADIAEEYRKFVEESGGREAIEEGMGVYKLLRAREFQPDAFWDYLAEKMPSRYDAAAMALFKSHQDYFTEQVLGLSKQEYAAFREWKAGGGQRGSAEEGPADEDLDPEDPLHKELIERRRAEREWRKQQQQLQLQEQEAAYRSELAARQQAVQAFDAERTQVIHKVIGDHQLDQFKDVLNEGQVALAKLLIDAGAQFQFAADRSALQLYEDAISHELAGDKALAREPKVKLDAQLGQTTVQVASFLIDLLKSKRELASLKRSSAADRRDLPVSAAQPPAMPGGDRHKNAKPFDPEAQKAKLRDLEASGRF